MLDEELIAAMRNHVIRRCPDTLQEFKKSRNPNSAWMMMLEAADRLENKLEEPDTSDIPEADADWFKRAKLKLPEEKNYDHRIRSPAKAG